MQPISFAALQEVLSIERLAAYARSPALPRAIVDQAGGGQLPSASRRMVVGCYRWNIALGTAIFPAIHLLELALREQIHLALTGHCGTPAWYDHSAISWQPHEAEAIRIAKINLARERKTIALARERKTIAPGRMVAALNLGFWCSLLSRRYEHVLWPTPLVRAFPEMPRRDRKRNYISPRLEAVRKLRNRISHHEPICNDPRLDTRYAEIVDALSWFSRVAGALLPIGEDFATVFARGPGFYEIDVS